MPKAKSKPVDTDPPPPRFKDIVSGEKVYIVHKSGAFTRVIKTDKKRKAIVIGGNRKKLVLGKTIKIKKNRAVYHAVGGHGQ